MPGIQRLSRSHTRGMTAGIDFFACYSTADWSSRTILTFPSSTWGAMCFENSIQKSPAVSGTLNVVLHATKIPVDP